MKAYQNRSDPGSPFTPSTPQHNIVTPSSITRPCLFKTHRREQILLYSNEQSTVIIPLTAWRNKTNNWKSLMLLKMQRYHKYCMITRILPKQCTTFKPIILQCNDTISINRIVSLSTTLNLNFKISPQNEVLY